MKMDEIFNCCLYVLYLLRGESIIGLKEYEDYVRKLQSEYQDYQIELRQLKERVDTLEQTRGYN